MLERRITVESPAGPVTGRLVSVGDDAVVLVRDDGDVVSVRKAEVTRLKVAGDAPEEPGVVQPDSPAEPEADASVDSTPPEDAPEQEANSTEPGEHRKLGVFTSHGVGYSRFRTSSFRDGGASYALDIGVGFNFKEKFGIYGLIGGLVGASLLDKQARGHFGHFAVSFRWKWKYFAFIPGLGVGISGIRGPGDAVDRRVGFALPIKAMGLIPLPKELFLGIGLGYDLGILPGRQLFNGIALQISVGRW